MTSFFGLRERGLDMDPCFYSMHKIFLKKTEGCTRSSKAKLRPTQVFKHILIMTSDFNFVEKKQKLFK